MIDAHCHLFNARSLPLEGIFRSRGVIGPVAALLDAALRALSADDGSLDPQIAQIIAPKALAVPAAIALASRGPAPAPRSNDQSVNWLVQRVPESLLLSRDLPKLKLPAAASSTSASAMSGAVGSVAPLAEARRQWLAAYLKKDGFGPGSIGEAVSFVVRLLGSERAMLQELQGMSDGVELHVHHMMDMEYAYADRPDYDFVRQLRRMRNLAIESGGRLIGFVAFEPFRSGAIRLVREALENGFCGVKFYPPSGYRPVDNIDTKITPIDPREIDHRNHELFTLCAEGDIPILAHCTPHGFERIPNKTGAFSNPEYWQRVLSHQRYRTLRLCLGHAGGDGGWLDPIPADGDTSGFAKTYAGRVVSLCNTYPNVYCEFSHMEGVLKKDGRKRLAFWLNAAISQNPVLASKIMYGSDFPMLLDQGPWSDYLPGMKLMFEEHASIRRHADAFFRGNALGFLNLPRFLRANESELTQVEKDYLASLALALSMRGARPSATTPAAAAARLASASRAAAHHVALTPGAAGPLRPAGPPRAIGGPPAAAEPHVATPRAIATLRTVPAPLAAPMSRAAPSPAPRAAASTAASASTAAASTLLAGLDPSDPVDCLVLGAGVSGVTAARELKRNYFGDPNETGADRQFSVLILEGSGRVGGRLHSLRNRFPVSTELGAELIHRAKPTLGGSWSLRNFWADVARYGLTEIPIDKLDNNARSTLIYFDQWSNRQQPLLRTGCSACNDQRFKAGIDALDAVNGYASLNDRTVADFIEHYICGNRGYCAANDIARATADYLLTGTVPGNSDVMSAASLRFDRVREQEHSDEEYHIVGGYDLLPGRMAEWEGIPVLHNAVVDRIEYSTQGPGFGARVHTTDGRTFHAKAVVCSFSIGMLKSGSVTFAPALPQYKLDALQKVDIGPESKVVMQFDARFWPNTMAILSHPGTTRKGGRSYFVPSYGQSDVPVITAFLTRQDAKTFDDLVQATGVGGEFDKAAAPATVQSFIENRVLDDLRIVFAQELATLGILPLKDHLVDYYCRSWANDPFAQGATSYVRFTGMVTDDVEGIRVALADPLTTLPLFWAGEATATDTQPWSVHGAHSSGVRAAWQVRRHLVLSGQ